MRGFHLIMIAIVVSCDFGSAGAEVVNAVPAGFTIKHVAEISKDSRSVWAAMLEVGHWWDAVHTYSGDANNLSLQPTVSGCFCEKVGDGGVEHMRVIQVFPGKLLRLSGGLGPLQQFGVAGSLTWQLEPTGSQSSRLTWTYVVGGYADRPLNEWAPAVDGVLAAQLQRLIRYIVSGAPGASRPAKSN